MTTRKTGLTWSPSAMALATVLLLVGVDEDVLRVELHPLLERHFARDEVGLGGGAEVVVALGQDLGGVVALFAQPLLEHGLAGVGAVAEDAFAVIALRFEPVEQVDEAGVVVVGQLQRVDALRLGVLPGLGGGSAARRGR